MRKLTLASSFHARTSLPLLAVAIFAAIGMGCGGKSSKSDYRAEDLSVETALDANILAPGETAQITCTVTHVTDGVVSLPTAVLAEPANGVQIDTKKRLTAQTPGIYRLTCALESDLGVRDATASLLNVTPGGVVAVDTTVAPNPTVAGESTTVTCAARDASGNLVNVDTTVRAVPEEGVTIAGETAVFTVAATHSVWCELTGYELVRDETPVDVEVLPGPPAKTTASLPDDEFPSGTETTVSCAVEDEFGNPVTDADLAADVSPDPGVSVDGVTLAMEAAGDYEVICDVISNKAAGGLETVGAPFEVVAGTAAGIGIVVVPDQPTYGLNDIVEVTWEVVDVWGNTVEDAEATLTGPLEGVTELDEPEWMLDAEGQHVFAVSLDSDPTINATRILVVDGTPPTLVITSPTRGSTFQESGLITVTGQVNDPLSGIASLTVANKNVLPAADGSFEVTVDSLHGLNLVIAQALDAADNIAETSVAWYYSTDWQPYVDTVAEEVRRNDAIRMFLGQDALDDGVHDPANVDDIATLLEILLGQADLQALAQGVLDPIVIPNIIDVALPSIPLPFTSDEIDFQLTGDVVIAAEFGELSVTPSPTLSLDSREGGIDVDGSFPMVDGQPALQIEVTIALSFPITLTASSDLGPATLSISPGLVSTTYLVIDELDFESGYDISKVSGQPLAVTSGELLLSIDGLDLLPLQNTLIDLGTITIFDTDIDLPEIELGSLVDDIGALLGDVTAGLTELVLDLAGPLLEPILGELAGGVIAAVLESVEIETPIELPPLLGAPGGEITLLAALDTVSFTEAGGSLGLESGAWSPKTVEPTPLGSMLRDGCGGVEGGQFGFDEALPLGIALNFDLLNQLLYAIWWAGVLELDAGPEALAELSPEIASFGVEGISLSATLPPVFSDCNGKDLLRLQLGDALLGLKADLLGLVIDAEFFVTLEADVNITANGDELSLELNGLTLLHFDAVEVNDAWEGKEAELEVLLEQVLQSQLEELLSGSLEAFPIPSIDLGGIVDGVPEGTELKIGSATSKKDKGFLSIEGDLE